MDKETFDKQPSEVQEEVRKSLKKQVTDNNDKVTKLLNENYQIMKEQCFLKNEEMYEFVMNKPEERFRIPKGYITKMNTLIIDYHLNDIFYNPETEENPELKEELKLKRRKVLNQLQMMEWIEYIQNNMFVYQSVEKQLWMHSIINIVSMIEALVSEAALHYSNQCTEMRKNKECPKDCPKAFKKKNNMTFNGKYEKGLVNVLTEKGLLTFDEEGIKAIHDLYIVRNNIIHPGSKKTIHNLYMERKNLLRFDSSRVPEELIIYKEFYYIGKNLIKEICNQLYENMAKYYKDGKCPEKTE